jgi:hypothetical protein
MIQNKILWISSSASEFKAQIINYTRRSLSRESGRGAMVRQALPPAADLHALSSQLQRRISS